MNHFMITNNMSEHVRKEIEAIQRLILPLARKSSRYMFWTVPLIGISVVNLIYLLFFAPEFMDRRFPVILYAFLGALGMALYREIKLNKREMEKISVQYMINRVKQSSFLGDDRKKYYIHLVEKMPVEAWDYFIRFLQEEERNKHRSTDEYTD